MYICVVMGPASQHCAKIFHGSLSSQNVLRPQHHPAQCCERFACEEKHQSCDDLKTIGYLNIFLIQIMSPVQAAGLIYVVQLLHSEFHLCEC